MMPSRVHAVTIHGEEADHGYVSLMADNSDGSTIEIARLDEIGVQTLLTDLAQELGWLGVRHTTIGGGS